MNLANSSVRSFTLLTSKNSMIFSTVSLSSEYSSQVSVIPINISTLAASFDLNIQQWRTKDRTCVILNFPMSAEYEKGKFQSFPIYGFATAECTMSYEELRQRCILYFRVCQAILKPQEFSPPWSYRVENLSIEPSYLLSILCTAERLVDENPALLFGAYPQYPPVKISMIEQEPVYASRLIKAVNQSIKEPYSTSLQESEVEIGVDLIQEALQQMIVVMFIDDRVVSTFSANSLTDGNYIQLDPIDMIILIALQSDEAFISGKIRVEDMIQEADTDLMSSLKTPINLQDTNLAIGTQTNEERDGTRMLYMRFQNRQMSVITTFRQLRLDYQHPDGTLLKARLCYIHPINKNLNSIYQLLKNNIQELVSFCKNIVNMYIAPKLESRLNEHTDHLLVNLSCPERHFSLRHQISAFPGLLQLTIINRTRGSMLSSDLSAVEKELSELQIHKQSKIITVSANMFKKHTFLSYPGGFSTPEAETPDLVIDYQQLSKSEIISKILQHNQMAKRQVAKLLDFVHTSLANGFAQALERDERFARVFYLFYFNIEDFSRCNIFDSSNTNYFMLPLSRQQLAVLNQLEEVHPVRRLEYLEQGGYIGSPQYYKSIDRIARETKQFKKLAGQFGQTANFELFQVQATFLKFSDVKDIQAIIVAILEQFVSLIWGK